MSKPMTAEQRARDILYDKQTGNVGYFLDFRQVSCLGASIAAAIRAAEAARVDACLDVIAGFHGMEGAPESMVKRNEHVRKIIAAIRAAFPEDKS